MRECVVCGSDISHKNKNAKTCSASCRSKLNRISKEVEVEQKYKQMSPTPTRAAAPSRQTDRIKIASILKVEFEKGIGEDFFCYSNSQMNGNEVKIAKDGSLQIEVVGQIEKEHYSRYQNNFDEYTYEEFNKTYEPIRDYLKPTSKSSSVRVALYVIPYEDARHMFRDLTDGQILLH